jgi:hypothetical protein
MRSGVTAPLGRPFQLRSKSVAIWAAKGLRGQDSGEPRTRFHGTKNDVIDVAMEHVGTAPLYP